MLSGINCFWVSSKELKFTEAISDCCKVGAQLATISHFADDSFVSDLMPLPDGDLIQGYWIGLNDRAVEERSVGSDN